MDTFDKKKRSEIMRLVKSKDTTPEKKVKKAIHNIGYKYRAVGKSNAIKSADFLIPELRAAIFVNGCFWHRHKGCKEATIPKTNRHYWMKKFDRNVIRDKENVYEIRRNGWKSITIWECETKTIDHLETLIAKKLGKKLR